MCSCTVLPDEGEKEKNMDFINLLPDELLVVILNQQNFKDLLNCRLVSPSWLAIIDSYKSLSQRIKFTVGSQKGEINWEMLQMAFERNFFKILQLNYSDLPTPMTNSHFLWSLKTVESVIIWDYYSGGRDKVKDLLMHCSCLKVLEIKATWQRPSRKNKPPNDEIVYRRPKKKLRTCYEIETLHLRGHDPTILEILEMLQTFPYVVKTINLTLNGGFKSLEEEEVLFRFIAEHHSGSSINLKLINCSKYIVATITTMNKVGDLKLNSFQMDTRNEALLMNDDYFCTFISQQTALTELSLPKILNKAKFDGMAQHLRQVKCLRISFHRSQHSQWRANQGDGDEPSYVLNHLNELRGLTNLQELEITVSSLRDVWCLDVGDLKKLDKFTILSIGSYRTVLKMSNSAVSLNSLTHLAIDRVTCDATTLERIASCFPNLKYLKLHQTCRGSYTSHFNGDIGTVRTNQAFSLQTLTQLEQLGVDDYIVDDCFLVGLKLPRLKQFTMFERAVNRDRSEDHRYYVRNRNRRLNFDYLNGYYYVVDYDDYDDYEDDSDDEEDYDSDASNEYQRNGLAKYTNITPLGLHSLAKNCPKLHEIKQNETVLCRRLSDIFVAPYSSVMDQHVGRDSNSD